jgi:cyclic pyranopterin phosphate synthase
MIDVSLKEETLRTVEASGKIYLKPGTINAIKERIIEKGDPIAVAEIASIQAVKKTPDLIPMCHNIPLGSVDSEFEINESFIKVVCRVTTYSKTGVEMEALTGTSVALLNIWDMVKYLEKDEKGQYPETIITEIKVTEKRKEEV